MFQAAVILFCGSFAWALAAPTPTPTAILEKMRETYAGVQEYRTNVEVRTSESDGSVRIEKFVYSFKKPNHVRLDLETPHQGAVVIYPDENGKVVVKRSESSRFLTLHLRPDSRLLRGRPGHRIDQSDMGLLIENIAHSLTDQRRGPIDTSQRDNLLVIRVLAVDHFQPSVQTLYEFLVDSSTWLPEGVTESTPEGRLARTTSFKNLRINPDLPGSFFYPD
jgi:outer membrane lipoprotein-sorting protein